MDAFHGRMWDKPTYIFKLIPWAFWEKQNEKMAYNNCPQFTCQLSTTLGLLIYIYTNWQSWKI